MSLSKTLRVILIFCLCPLIGMATGFLISQGFENRYQNILIEKNQKEKGIDVSTNGEYLKNNRLENICKDGEAEPGGGAEDVCKNYKQIKLLEYGSALTFLLILLQPAILIFFRFMARLGGKSSTYIIKLLHLLTMMIFVVLTMANFAVLIIANFVIIFYCLYFLEFYFALPTFQYFGWICALVAIVLFLRRRKKKGLC